MASVPEHIIEIKLYRSPPLHPLLEGLRIWQDLGLLTDDSLYLSLPVDTTHPAILEGLEIWLNLGLIDRAQVKKIAIDHLYCTLPEPELVSLPIQPEMALPPALAIPKLKPAPQPSWISQRLDSLKAELSVRWLLFLGLFLVVLASGVFAASQWENFPAVGQYGVLLAYTGLFSFISNLVDRKENLKLTSGALKLVTLLLIPVNFWAMDDFGLWNHPINLIVILGSAIYLTAIARTIWTHSEHFPFPLFNYLILSYLQWGWSISNVPIMAVYLATIGSLSFYYYQFRDRQISLRTSLAISRLSLYAIGILLFRAIFVQGVLLPHLGLAIALCGTFLVWLAQTRTSARNKTLNQLGIALIIFAWLVSIWVNFPWQGVVISLMGIQVFDRFLKRYQHRQDLIFIWLIGAQIPVLLWNFITAENQERIFTIATQFTQSENNPIALLSLIGLPYLIWIVNTGDRLYQKNQPKLAQFAEIAALGLGINLIIFSLSNSSLRIWCLTNLVFLIIWVTKRRYDLEILNSFYVLVYLNHLTGLGLVLSLINYGKSNLNLETWGIIFLGIMVGEWWFSDLRNSATATGSVTKYHQIWKQSAWVIGWGLAAIAYGFFFANIEVNNFSLTYLSWFAVPATLTLISYSPHSCKQDIAPRLSMVSIFFAEGLIFDIPGWRVLGLAIAVFLMAFNTRKLAHWGPCLGTATLTVGCGIGALGLGLWDLVPGIPPLVSSSWLMIGAIAATGLWTIRGYTLQKRNNNYARALDIWAIALCTFVIILHGIWIQQGQLTSNSLSVATSILLCGATAYRSWFPLRQPVAIRWSVVALMGATLSTMSAPSLRCLSLAIATLIIIGHTRYLPTLSLSAMTVGLGLVTEGVILFDSINLSPEAGWLMGSVNVLGLWIGAQQLRLGKKQWQRQLTRLYRRSFDGWAIALCVFWLTLLTIHSILVYYNWIYPTPYVFISLILLLVAIAIRTIAYHKGKLGNPNNSTGYPLFNWSIFGIGWTIELLTVETLASLDAPILNLAIANLILGIGAQFLGDWWQHRTQQENLMVAWHIVPLGYSILGTLLRWGTWNSWTGITTLILAITILGIGKRSPQFKPLVYLAIFGITACAYELLFYQLSVQPEGTTGDGLILMATLGTSILYAYRLLQKLIRHYLHLTPREYHWTCHLHWFGSSLFLIMATVEPIDTGMSLGFATGALLVLYAFSQGRYTPTLRRGELWVYMGFLQALAMRIYWLSTPLAQLIGGSLAPWKGAIATLFAYFLYFLPWHTWGWSQQPWKLAGILIPLYAIVENPSILNQVSLIVIASYYLGLAIVNRQIRFTYLSLGVVNWMLWRWLSEFGITELFWYSLPLNLSLLYIIHVDPFLQTPERKKLRHNLRTLISVIIGLSSFSAEQWIGTLTGIISLLAIFIGLSLKTRAFLYVGTAIFLLNIFYQLGILIFDYPFSKWLVALGVGISLIWIAATFETRREQIQVWFQELQRWD